MRTCVHLCMCVYCCVSQVEAPLQATPPQTVPMQTEAAAADDDPFASFVEEDSKDKSQPSAEGVAMDVFGAPTGGGGFGAEQQVCVCVVCALDHGGDSP